MAKRFKCWDNGTHCKGPGPGLWEICINAFPLKSPGTVQPGHIPCVWPGCLTPMHGKTGGQSRHFNQKKTVASEPTTFNHVTSSTRGPTSVRPSFVSSPTIIQVPSRLSSSAVVEITDRLPSLASATKACPSIPASVIPRHARRARHLASDQSDPRPGPHAGYA